MKNIYQTSTGKTWKAFFHCMSMFLAGMMLIQTISIGRQSTAATIDNISKFEPPLQEEITSFKAYRSFPAIALDWTAATEINMDGYLIERSSDSVHFSLIGFVPAKNNGDNETKYYWVDNSPYDGNNFYRLKIIGKNGHVSYSRVVGIDYECNENIIQVAPNPTNGPVTITGLADMKGGILELVELTGVIISTFRITNNMMTIDLSHQAAGIYLLRMRNNTKAKIYKLIRM